MEIISEQYQFTDKSRSSSFEIPFEDITRNITQTSDNDGLLHVSNALTRLVAAGMFPKDIAQHLAVESHGTLPTHEYITGLFTLHPDYFNGITEVEKRFFLYCGLSYGITQRQNQLVSSFENLTQVTSEDICALHTEIQSLSDVRNQLFRKTNALQMTRNNPTVTPTTANV